MAALFPPWANTATRVVLIALAAAITTAIVAPIVYARMPYATGAGDPLLQPIPFDHRHHVRDDAIDCLYCHEDAERSPYAGVPAAERCLGCHDQIWNDSLLIAPLRASAATTTRSPSCRPAASCSTSPCTTCSPGCTRCT
jgi:hypothetical protein